MASLELLTDRYTEQVKIVKQKKSNLEEALKELKAEELKLQQLQPNIKHESMIYHNFSRKKLTVFALVSQTGWIS